VLLKLFPKEEIYAPEYEKSSFIGHIYSVDWMRDHPAKGQVKPAGQH
jgi:hypothetical protein